MKNKYIRIGTLLAILMIGGYGANAQTTSLKLGTNPTIKNPSALIELEANNKGALLPRVALTSTIVASPVTAPANALTVFNTATSGTAPNNVTPGYYYWSTAQSKWVKLLSAIDITTEPWYNQATNDGATANTQNIYQNGKVGIGNFGSALSTKQFEVKGDFKSEVISGNTVFGTEVASATNPQGAMHYWQNTNGDFRVSSANSTAAALLAKTGTTTNTISVEETQAALSSQNGTNSLSGIRSTNTGNFFMESYNVTSNFGSTISLQNDGMRLRHTNTNGAADPFPLNNSTEIFVQKTNGVRFNFRDAAGAQAGEYWFPITTGTAGQVMTQSASGKMVWSNPTLSVPEVDGVIGNEVTNATTNGGLTRVGAGTDVSPYTLGLTPGSATGNVMTWNGTAWNPANPVNIYNADGSLTGTETSRTLALNGKTLNFDGTDRRTYWDKEGRIHQRATNTALDAAMGFHNSGANLWIQQWSAGSAITASNNSTELLLGTHFTQVAAPIIFNTSIGGNTTGVERMRITGTGKIGMGTFTPSEQLDNTGITRLRNLPLNGATNAINTTAAGAESASQDQTFTATRTVVADVNGVLGTVAGLPANPVNIYNANGTLTANRTVNMDGKTLRFQNSSDYLSISTEDTGYGTLTAFGTTRGNLRAIGGVGGNVTLDVMSDNNSAAQLSATGSGLTALHVGTGLGSAKPLHLMTNGLNRMTVTSTGEVAIGTSTAPSFTVGTGPSATTIQPKLHVAGDISTTGKVWTTNSVYADYVFEKYFAGKSALNPSYEFKSLNYVRDFIKANNHLPGVTSIADLKKANNGYTFDMTKLTIQSLEKIEELYLHTIEQKDKIDAQQAEIDKLKKDAEDTKSRLERLEKLLNKGN